jgi:signal transduction histidine kinase
VHPVFTKKGHLPLYLAAWVPGAALLASVLSLHDGRGWPESIALGAVLAIAAAFMSFGLWPLCRTLRMTRTSSGLTVAVSAAAAGLTSFVWVSVGAVPASFLEYALHYDGAGARYRDDVRLLLVVGILLFGLALVVHYLMLAFESARNAERDALEMQILAREAELRALRAQLNPHFLFNSLNAIASLAGSDPARARRMTVLLSEFLRRSMTLGVLPDVTLAEELDLLDDYWAIEQVRFGDRLRIERQVTPEALACRVPPLVLQPLAENAIQHGVSTTLDGGTVVVSARRVADRLEIAVENPYDADRPRREGHGMGLANVRARLAAQHPAATRIDVGEGAKQGSDATFRVVIQLPVVTSEAAVAQAPIGAATSPPALTRAAAGAGRAG